MGSTSGSGRSPGEGNGDPFLAWKFPWTEESDGVTKSWTQLSTHAPDIYDNIFKRLENFNSKTGDKDVPQNTEKSDLVQAGG